MAYKVPPPGCPTLSYPPRLNLQHRWLHARKAPPCPSATPLTATPPKTSVRSKTTVRSSGSRSAAPSSRRASTAGLTVDDVSNATRVRITIIHAIEQDDFTPCGGDVYARGHIRTLARAVQLDPAPLLAQYDADHGGRPAPTPAAPLFEAERIRPERRGPNWTAAMVAAIVAVIGFVGFTVVKGATAATTRRPRSPRARRPPPARPPRPPRTPASPPTRSRTRPTAPSRPPRRTR